MESLVRTMTSLRALSRLLRLPLAAMVALTAMTAALAADPTVDGSLLRAVAWGIFLLAAACSVLNQVQERLTDALMTRTCRRPLAVGLVSPRAGGIIGMLFGSTGLAILYAGTTSLCALLGLLAMAWYLLAYTPLKRVSSLAVLAGTPCGVVPLLIGWQAAGGTPSAPPVMALCLALLLWQVPHTWVVAIPERHELELAGFKVLPATLSSRKILYISHFWILGLATVSLLLPLLEVVRTPLLQGVTGLMAIGLAVWASGLQRRTLFIEKTAHSLRFGLHLYLGLLFGIVLVECVLTRLAIH